MFKKKLNFFTEHLFKTKLNSQKASNNIVEVIRYFRIWKNGCISSNGGMTAICILNYKNMTLTIYPSFCSIKDNFSKHEGKIAASVNKNRGAGFIFPLEKGKSIHLNILKSIDNKTYKPTNEYAEKNLKKHLINWYNHED